MAGMIWFKKVSDALFCCLGFVVFAYFIHHPFPLRLISFAGLAIPAMVMSRNLALVKDVKELFGEIKFKYRTIISLLVAMLSGIGLSMLYRSYIGMPFFITSITWFAITATFIGALEEFVFRGFIQGHLSKWNVPFSIFFGTFSHTAYKGALFLSPILMVKVDLTFLLFWTFCFGILFGVLKHYSRSLLVPMLAHALFDILVYGQCLKAPWWVW